MDQDNISQNAGTLILNEKPERYIEELNADFMVGARRYGYKQQIICRILERGHSGVKMESGILLGYRN